MKTYRIRKIVNGNALLKFEVYSYEDELEGEEPDIEISLKDNRFKEGDWVYFDEKGNLSHIDEIEFKSILKRLNEARKKTFQRRFKRSQRF